MEQGDTLDAWTDISGEIEATAPEATYVASDLDTPDQRFFRVVEVE
ncbi:MAG: hypothetical protein HC888_01255 [Candidatus Competibacteraceae bacterium]|nr:hypothetical protein [Candidatus Competibacteraceae bacterium]